MPMYTVLGASVKKELPDAKNGPAKVIALNLQNERGAIAEAEWFTSARTPLPQDNTKIEGDVTPSDYGLKFKPTQSRGGGYGGGGGYKGKTPSEQASIAASVALDKALIAVEQAATLGVVKVTSQQQHAEAIDHYFSHFFGLIDAKGKAA